MRPILPRQCIPTAKQPIAKRAEFFTVVFYGLAICCCKTAQFCVKRCERYWPETPSFCDDVQRTENTRKKLFLELEIRCSIRLSYGRRISRDIYCVSGGIKAVGATRFLPLLFRDKH